MDFMSVLLGKLTDCCFISTYTPINFLQIGMEAGINIDTEIMIKLNVTLRNITLFGVLKNQCMLNRIFSFMDLGEKNRIMIYHIHFSKHGCFIIQSNILLFWEREVTSMV